MKRKMCGSFLPLFLLLCILSGCAKGESPILTVGSHAIDQEEFLFYCDVAKKELIDRQDTQTLYQKAMQQASKTYALLELAMEYRVIDHFSFEGLSSAMEQENKERSEKVARGESVMGARQYKLEDYFNYVLADYKKKLVTAIAKTSEPALLDQARVYYDTNRDSYVEGGEYVYRVRTVNEIGEETEAVETISYEELKSSYHSKDLLGDVLYAGKVGEEYDLGDSKVTLLERNLTYKEFEDDRAAVMEDFIIKQYLPEQVEERSETLELNFYEERLNP